MSTPLARTEDGAVLGPDYRRVPGMSKYAVPGFVPAEFVMPGDRVTLGVESFLVLRVIPIANTDKVELVTRTWRGAEIAVERQRDQLVQVIDAGAFDR